jgi:hypothetical protein
VKEYGIRSYLGIPIRARDTVIGSLCVIDTKERRFSDTERENLAELAALVDERVMALTESRHQTRLALSEGISGLGLAELRESLRPICGSAEAGLLAMQAIRTFLRLCAYVLEGGTASPEVLARTLEAASEAADAAENAFYDVEVAAGDCEDCTLALAQLITPSSSTRLSEVLTGAQDLARQSTEKVGGAPLPDFVPDPIVHTPRPLAIALLATSLTTLAERLGERPSPGGIRMQIRDLDVTVVNEQIGQDPSVAIRAEPGAVLLAFTVVESEKS